MNSGVFQSCRVKQMIKGNPSCWDMNNPRPTPLQTSHPLISPPSLTSSSPFSQYPHPSILLPMTTWNDNQELPESWSQLLLGGFGEEEDRCCFSPFQPKRMENWNDEVDVKQEISEGGYDYGHRKEEWTRTLQTASPSSCATGLNNNSNMFDFSSSKAERSNHQLDHSSEARQIECNSTATGSAVKKARTEASSTQSTFKVRKEKLGDRITALHQLVSPYGKTDTASVLLEAIGYIRFLQSQIEVLSSPYLSCGSGSVRQSVQGERSCIFPEDPGQLLNDINMNRRGPSDQVGDDEPKDLKRRGLCLVPMSFMLHVGSNNGADYWAPSYGGVF